MVSTKFRVTHAHPPVHARHAASSLEARADSTQTSDDCRTGKTKFITSPALGSTLPISSPIKVTWDPSCLPSTTAVKILLYAPGTNAYLLHWWDQLDIKRGEYEITIDPTWYGGAKEQQMQVSIVPSDLAFAALLDLPAGPVFTATNDGTSTAASSAPSAAAAAETEASGTIVGDFKKLLGAGKIAAAVILPILFITLIVLALIKFKRKRGKEKRKRWSEMVDKRMSTISADWKSVSAAGASAAIRNSIAAGSIRASMYEGGGQAGVGAGAYGEGYNTTGVGLRQPRTSSVTGERQSRVSFADAPRQSRVSFADSARPSMERKSRAFHVGHVPPVPALPALTTDSYSNEYPGENEKESMSPTQTVGAMSLTPEDIRARIGIAQKERNVNVHGGKEKSGESMDAEGMEGVMPALSLMRTGATASTDDLLLAPSPAPSYSSNPSPTMQMTMPMPTPPAAIYTPTSAIANPASSPYTTPTSPVMSTPMPMPMVAMSPDDMLRAYAERRKMLASPPPTVGGKVISHTVPAGQTGPLIFQSTGEQGHNKNESVGVGMYGGAKYVVGDDEDAYAYGGTA